MLPIQILTFKGINFLFAWKAERETDTCLAGTKAFGHPPAASQLHTGKSLQLEAEPGLGLDPRRPISDVDVPSNILTAALNALP